MQNYKLATTQATKVQACCHTGIEQNYKLTATQAKTTSLSPHSFNTKTTSLLPQRRNYKQNYKLAATQA